VFGVWDHSTIDLDPSGSPPRELLVCSSCLQISFEAYYYFTYAPAVGRGSASGRFDPG
jgi:hypothetical protein